MTKSAIYRFLKKHALIIFLVGGLIFDSLTLQRPDRLAENLFILANLVIAAGCIFIANHPKSSARAKFWSTGAMQFTFGGLFKSFLVFYARSASFSASWPVFILLVGLLLGTELFKKHYERIAFQLSLFYFCLFTFLSFFLSIVFKSISVWVFVAAGLVSLAVMFLVGRTLLKISKEQVAQSRKAIRFGVVGVYLAINFLYFTNLIPPIPLAMKEAGVYHSVARVGNDYQALAEQESWFDRFWPGQTLQVASGRPLYFFSAIFSPSDLDINIVHEWWYYDEGTKDWVMASRVPISVVGGREGGYRSYSYLIPRAGKWRVDVETPRGQVIGRVRFKVEIVNREPQLIPEQL